MEFTFNRSGKRVPAIAISAWIPPRAVLTEEYRHTSLIRTLRERWALGTPLTARDASAPDLGPIPSLSVPRQPDQSPIVVPRAVPRFDVALLPPDRPLSVLGKGMFHAVLAYEKMLGARVPTVAPDATLTGAQATAIMRDTAFSLFPGLRTKA
jgi:phospholipase C